MIRVHCDAETFSRVSLSEAGAANYFDDESTGIHVWGYLPQGGEIEALTVRQIFFESSGQISKRTPKWVIDEFRALVKNPSTRFVAHNAKFEIRCYKRFLQHLFGPIDIDRWICTMAKAHAHGLPGSLENMANALHLKHRKMESKDFEKLFSYNPKTGRPWQYYQLPELFEKMYTYNGQDIYVEAEADETLDDLTPYETLVWQIDHQINDHGVLFDLPLVTKINEWVEREKAATAADFREIVNFNPTQRPKFKQWLAAQGVPVRNTKKPTLLAAKSGASKLVCDTIDAFIGANKSSLAKYSAILRRTDSMGVVKESKVYSRAHTRRWGSVGIQLDNLATPRYSIPHLAENVMACTLEQFEFLYEGNTTLALSSLLRGTIISRPDHEFFIGDYAQMEQRVLAWLAGQQDALEAAKRKEDPYCLQASKVYRTEITKKDPRRQVGKINVLAFGFEGGIGACNKFARDLDADLEALYYSMYVPTATGEERENAKRSYVMHKKRKDEHNAKVERDGKGEYIDPGTIEECLAADLLKQRWRQANKEIVQYWSDVQNAAINAVQNPGSVYAVGPNKNVSFFMHRQFLICRLPSGGHICYPFPRVTVTKRGKKTLSYMFEDKENGNRWVRESTYGGKLTENIVQATQRDLLADAMIRLHRIGYQIILHVHDEIVCEIRKGFGTLEVFQQAMAKKAKWCTDLPVDVEAFITERYRKSA